MPVAVFLFLHLISSILLYSAVSPRPPPLQFITQAESISLIVRLSEEFLMGHPDGLILLGAYNIGDTDADTDTDTVLIQHRAVFAAMHCNALHCTGLSVLVLFLCSLYRSQTLVYPFLPWLLSPLHCSLPYSFIALSLIPSFLLQCLIPLIYSHSLLLSFRFFFQYRLLLLITSLCRLSPCAHYQGRSE